MEKELWFLHHEGKTLGPLTARQIKASLRLGELHLDDKIALANDTRWQKISDHSAFREHAENPISRADQLVSPLAPHLVWKKKRETLTAPSGAVTVTETMTVAVSETEMETITVSATVQETPAAAPPPPAPEAPVAFTRTPIVMEATAIPPMTGIPAAEEVFSLIASLRDWQKEEAPLAKPPVRKSQKKLVLLLLGLALLASALVGLKKMRDLRDSRLLDPSPTNELSTEGDPIPPLKAPTRPQRE